VRVWRPILDLCDGGADGLDLPGSDEDKWRAWWRMTWIDPGVSSASDTVGMCVADDDATRVDGSRCNCVF
jgi:hypothetical protein